MLEVPKVYEVARVSLISNELTPSKAGMPGQKRRERIGLGDVGVGMCISIECPRVRDDNDHHFIVACVEVRDAQILAGAGRWALGGRR